MGNKSSKNPDGTFGDFYQNIMYKVGKMEDEIQPLVKQENIDGIAKLVKSDPLPGVNYYSIVLGYALIHDKNKVLEWLLDKPVNLRQGIINACDYTKDYAHVKQQILSFIKNNKKALNNSFLYEDLPCLVRYVNTNMDQYMPEILLALEPVMVYKPTKDEFETILEELIERKALPKTRLYIERLV